MIMSRFGRWNLWLGLGLVVLAAIFLMLKWISVGVIVAIVGLLGLGIAAYDAIYYALQRAELRRRGAEPRRES